MAVVLKGPSTKFTEKEVTTSETRQPLGTLSSVCWSLRMQSERRMEYLQGKNLRICIIYKMMKSARLIKKHPDKIWKKRLHQ